MIYLDNAATTYPKPPTVRSAVNRAFTQYGANPGRSGYNMSVSTSEEVYKCRKVICDFFNVDEPENVIFTSNCTHSINIVLKGFLKKDDHVVISELEHNCVLRPLNRLKEIGVTYTKAKVYPQDNDKTVDSFRKSINEKTRLIICMHASNVWGIRLPIERIGALAHLYGIPVLVDAAQSAGVIPIDYKESGIDFLCIAGHKGLYGPMGTGILITNKGSEVLPFIEGGTGTNSVLESQPEALPDKFESGTVNVPGIIGLKEGINFVKRQTPQKIFTHEMNLIEYLYDRLSKIEGVKLYTPFDKIHFVPVLSFNIDGLHSEETASALSKYGIAVRGGLHCAPSAHTALDTLNVGTARVSVSFFNTKRDIDILINSIKRVQNSKI